MRVLLLGRTSSNTSNRALQQQIQLAAPLPLPRQQVPALVQAQAITLLQQLQATAVPALVLLLGQGHLRQLVCQGARVLQAQGKRGRGRGRASRGRGRA